jgi:hypothetical protein
MVRWHFILHCPLQPVVSRPRVVSQLKKILSYHDATVEIRTGCVDPHLIRNFRILRRYQV